MTAVVIVDVNRPAPIREPMAMNRLLLPEAMADVIISDAPFPNAKKVTPCIVKGVY